MTATLMKLHRVCPGKYLHFPPEIDKKDPLWLPPGGVLDLDDPFVAKCIVGQEYKLEPDDTATEPTPILHTRFLNIRAAFLAAGEPTPAPGEPERPPEAKQIPKPDERPTRGKEKRRDEGKSPVPQVDPR
jgi:hypothetical protein